MGTSWDWPGSSWWRFDLHTHSPASYDFAPEDDRNAKDWGKWVTAAQSAGLHAIAVTDHNTPNGVLGIKSIDTALFVFPGVEITVGGIHLLCVFDPSAGRDEVVALLSKIGIDPANFGRQDTTSTKSIVDVIHAANEAGAVVISAHVNGPKGLLVELEGQQRLQALKCNGLAAVEVAPLPPVPTGWLDPLGPEVISWLDGTHTDGCKHSQIWCSDGHSHSDLGRRFTWLKMTQPNAEGLRLALLDGEGSIQVSKSPPTDDPNRHASLVIQNISVTQAQYMGRSNPGLPANPLKVDFNPWLNTIIGGRGTGKSTLVDFCRKSLQRSEELGAEGDGSLRQAFDNRMRIPPNRNDEGLLTPDTVVEISYRKDGEQFSITWDNSVGKHTIHHISAGTKTLEEGDIQERFPVRIYSQKQLFDLAKEPNALLGIIDDSNEVQIREVRKSIKEVETSYLSLFAEARALRAKATDLPSRKAALGDLKRKLEVLQQGSHAQLLSDYRLRRKQNEAWDQLISLSKEALEAISHAVTDYQIDFEFDTDGSKPTDSAIDALKQLHDRARTIVEGVTTEVLSSVHMGLAELDALQSSPESLEWQRAYQISEQSFLTITKQLTDLGISSPDEYRDLLTRSTSIIQEIESLEKQKLEADEQEKQANEALLKYRKKKSDLSNRRSSFATSNSTSLIHVEIKTDANREGLEAHIRKNLVIERFDDDIRQILDQIDRDPASNWTFSNLDNVIQRLRDFLSDPNKSWGATDRRFEAALRRVHPEQVDRLALFLPKDRVEVTFCDVVGGSSRWRQLAQGSPGQQTAALLAFVLGYGHEPIILDQPEDDLDSTLIYKLLVSTLREKKSGRQIIVVTHNPNIVVHGDAELVISLDSNKGQSRVEIAGGLQEQKVRDEICKVMEGGRDAFESRYRRIMLPR